jgi:simple sugar transport system permease protein
LDLLQRLPVLDTLFNHQPALVYFALLLPFVLHFFFYHTQWGAWVRAAGENPRALAVAGVKPVVLRYLSIIFGGMMAGMGGAYLSISQMSLFIENMTAGRGFIGLSAVIFGNWKPLGVLLASLFFGFTDALQLTLQIAIPDSKIPREFFMALPYLLTLAALAGFISRAVPPASLAQPYSEEGR